MNFHEFSSISFNMLANCERCHETKIILKLAYVRDLETMITIPYKNINIIPIVPGLWHGENPGKSIMKIRDFR